MSKRSMIWLAVAGATLLVVGGIGWQLLASRLTLKPASDIPNSAAAKKASAHYPLGMEFAAIPAGTFRMGGGFGEADENPVHEVTISQPFRLQTTPITVGQFRTFTVETGYRTEAEQIGKAWARDNQTGKWDETNGIHWLNPEFTQDDSCPVICITWNDTQAFLEWLNQKDPGKGYRLPTEAEWEYACRAKTTGVRYGDLEAIAWYGANSGMRTHPVGQKAPNAFGLFDMLGNAWQWCQDGYGPYPNGPVTDPKGNPTSQHRVLRGGSWFSAAESCHAAGRTKGTTDSRGNYVGFRVACNG